MKHSKTLVITALLAALAFPAVALADHGDDGSGDQATAGASVSQGSPDADDQAGLDDNELGQAGDPTGQAGSPAGQPSAAPQQGHHRQRRRHRHGGSGSSNNVSSGSGSGGSGSASTRAPRHNQRRHRRGR